MHPLLRGSLHETKVTIRHNTSSGLTGDVPVKPETSM